MYSDKEGVMHFGTQGGLAIFDGKDFQVLNQQDGLSSNHVTAIFEDSRDRMWLGHRYDAPTVIDGDSIYKLEIPGSELFRSSSEAIVEFNGNIWIATAEDGLFEIDYDEGSIEHYHQDKDFISDAVNALFIDENRLWVSTNAGLLFHEGDGFQPIDFELHGISQVYVSSLIRDYKGDYIISFARNVYKASGFDQGVFSGLEEIISASDFPFGTIGSTYSSPNNGLWLISNQGALQFYDNKLKRFTSENGLDNSHVSSICEDREGNIWLGLFGQGVFQYLGEDFETYDTSTGLSNATVQAITVVNNQLWVGTEIGLTVYTFEDTNFVRPINVDVYDASNHLIDDEVYGLYKDTHGHIWISSYNGLVRYKPESGKFEKFPSRDDFLVSFILTISEDDEGNIWACSLREGCTRIILGSSREVLSTETYKKENKLSSDNVWRAFRDSKSMLWIGTNDNGFTRYKAGEFSYHGEADGLTNLRPGSITEDIYGNIWTATIGGGIFSFDGDTYSNYTTADGIGSDNPYFVEADLFGNVWIGTNFGVDRFNVKTKEITHFGKNEGFTGVETNQNASYADEYGNMWFGTINGLIRCRPDNIHMSETPPLTRIQNIRIFLKDENVAPASALDYTQNHITFDFTGIHYTSPKHVQYTFFLEGFDKEWAPVTVDNAATYSNLPPGEYVFKVKAINRDGTWSDEVAFPFSITPPFWMTMSFQIGAAVAFILLIYLVFRFRTANLRKQRQKLSYEVQKRTQELENEKKKVEDFNVKLAHQKELLELKNKDITDSIKYAQRIQSGMLPGRDEIEAIVPNSFIFFKPRDIVSGDFYWCKRIGDVRIFAVIDCTGHGVPGAFMSIIGNDLLNQVATMENVSNPGSALKNLDKRLEEYFLKEGSLGINDGMDVAMCALYPDNKLEFSGAKRPLYHVRDGEINVLPSNRGAIGGLEDMKGEFATHEVEMKKGDCIYMFSDGFVDQFGGKRGKKFMAKRLKELLLNISELEMDEQKRRLRKAFDEWASGHEQVDDVLVWGVKF